MTAKRRPCRHTALRVARRRESCCAGSRRAGGRAGCLRHRRRHGGTGRGGRTAPAGAYSGPGPGLLHGVPCRAGTPACPPAGARCRAWSRRRCRDRASRSPPARPRPWSAPPRTHGSVRSRCCPRLATRVISTRGRRYGRAREARNEPCAWPEPRGLCRRPGIRAGAWHPPCALSRDGAGHPGGSEAARVKGPLMVEEDFRPRSRIRQHLKDVDLMLSAAAGHRLALPLTSPTPTSCAKPSRTGTAISTTRRSCDAGADRITTGCNRKYPDRLDSPSPAGRIDLQPQEESGHALAT